MDEKIKVTAAGEIQIDELMLLVLLEKGTFEIDISRVFAEINLFEDLFSNSMYGNILIADSNNLLDQLSIQGLEGLRIDMRTPGLSEKQRINKTFGIYAISDQQVLNNDRYQAYRLHFCSLELLGDALTKPLNRPIPSKSDNVGQLQHEIVPFIYKKYFIREGGNYIPRNLKLEDQTMTKDGTSDLVLGAALYDHTTMEFSGDQSEIDIYSDGTSDGNVKMQFIAPNWTPLKTINWVTNRSIPKTKEQAGSFLFYESNKAYHYASVDALIKAGRDGTAQIFKYQYDPSNLAAPDKKASNTYKLDVAGEYGRVLKVEVQNYLNLLDSQNMGYFGMQLRLIDPLLKRYREQNFSSADVYEKQEHTVGVEAAKKAVQMVPKAPNLMLGRKDTVIDQRRNIAIRHRQPYFMFDNDKENPVVNSPQWLAYRAARMAALTNFSLQILVNGRTDMKVGVVINFQYPSLRGDKEDKKTDQDKYFNGFFLVTAIRHFISPIKHQMTLEIMKDGLEQVADKEGGAEPQGLAADYEK